MGRLNRSSLHFLGLVVSLGASWITGCGFDTHGAPSDTSSSGSGSGGNGGGAGGEGGIGGAGGGKTCVPDAIMACYSGPVETTNKGICKVGNQKCLPDGSGYGDCVGEVLPQTENCVMPGDEDCDGLSDIEDTECVCVEPGKTVVCDTKLKGVCATGTGACGPDGRSVDACIQDKQASPENCVTPEDDDCDGVVTPACSGEPLGAFTPAGTDAAMNNDDSIFSVALTPDGGYVIAGMTNGALGGDAFNLSMTPAGRAYIAKLDATGAKVWERTYSATSFAVARGVAVDKSGNIIVTGSFAGDMMVEGDLLSSMMGTPDAFVIKFDSAGMKLVTRVIGGNGIQHAYGITFDKDGNYALIGTTDDVVNFGSGPLPPNGIDFFVASYSATNTPRWGKLFASAGNQFARGITALPVAGMGDDFVVVGDTDDSTNLGGGVMMKDKSVDVFVARYANADGNLVWGKLYGKGADQFGRGVSIAPNGNVLITGGFAGTIDWGGGVMMSKIGTSDVFVAELAVADGTHVAHAQGGKTGTSVGNAVATDAAGNVTVFGHFNGSLDFGAGTITSSTGSNDAFLVKLQVGTWTQVWTKTYGKMGNQYGWDVAVNTDGTSIVGGGYYTQLDVPPNPVITNPVGSDLYGIVVKP